MAVCIQTCLLSVRQGLSAALQTLKGGEMMEEEEEEEKVREKVIVQQ